MQCSKSPLPKVAQQSTSDLTAKVDWFYTLCSIKITWMFRNIGCQRFEWNSINYIVSVNLYCLTAFYCSTFCNCLYQSRYQYYCSRLKLCTVTFKNNIVCSCFFHIQCSTMFIISAFYCRGQMSGTMNSCLPHPFSE